MSDIQKLTDAIKEYRKANAELDKKLNEIEENIRRNRKEQEEKSLRLY